MRMCWVKFTELSIRRILDESGVQIYTINIDVELLRHLSDYFALMLLKK